jgi:hypothetical protein
MFYEYYEDEVDLSELPELEYDPYSYQIVDEVVTLSPDPLLVTAVAILVGLILLGVLTRLTNQIFGAEFDKLTSASAAIADSQITQSDASTSKSTEKSLSKSQSGECAVSERFPQTIRRWCNLITYYAAEHGLDPDLVAALVWLESGGNELAYSRSGAVGLMQIMPRDGKAASFMCANGPCFRDRPSMEELRDPEFNIAWGTRFLAGLIRKKGNLREALKSYGPMDAGYSYSDKVLSIFNRYKSD